jgi:exodeoxyribonuclease VIII
MLINTGIFSELPFDEYLQIDALNCSTLKKCAQSPLHAQHALINPSEPTPAFVIGDAFHGLVLEQERFDTEYALGLDRPKRTKADKEAWEEWLDEHPNQTALKLEDWEAVHSMREAVLAHPTAAEIMAGQGENELTMVWKDPDNGTLCKGRADRLTTLGGESVIADLKSTQDSSPEGWGRSSARFLYHCQAAWYLAGANELAPLERRFLFICCEKKAPYGVTVQELNEDALKAGAKLNRIYLNRWLKCLKTKNFTGYPDGVLNYGLPAWALNEIDKIEE